MRTISLHIGLPHAGSTSIQTCLLQNRSSLLDAGVLYPRSPGKRSHGSLASYALEAQTVDRRRRRKGIADAGAVHGFRRDLEAGLAAELAGSGAGRVILSAEQLSWELRSRGEVERLAALLRRHGVVDRVVLYVRPQADLWISHRVNGMKRGRRNGASLLGALTSLRRLDYWRTLERWRQVFGEDAIRLRILDAAGFVGGSLYDDFIAVMDLPPDSLPIRPPPKNEALGSQAVAILQKVNPTRDTSDGRMSAADHAMIKTLRRMEAGQKPTVPRWQRALLTTVFAASNRRVARLYLGRDELFIRHDQGDVGVPENSERGEAATLSKPSAAAAASPREMM